MSCLMSGSGPSDLSGLVALAQQRELDLRPVILRVQTDLFLTAPARDRAMIEAFEALACGLVPIVDEDTAAIVARKLAPIEDTPEPVLQALAARGGRALRAVLVHALSVPASILELAAKLGSEVETAMAARPGLSSGTIRDLVGLGREAVDLALAANANIALRGSALDTLLERARANSALASVIRPRAD